MAWTVVAEQHHVVGEVSGVEFGKRTTCSSEIEDLHRLDVLYFVFTSDRHVVGCQQRITGND